MENNPNLVPEIGTINNAEKVEQDLKGKESVEIMKEEIMNQVRTALGITGERTLEEITEDLQKSRGKTELLHTEYIFANAENEEKNRSPYDNNGIYLSEKGLCLNHLMKEQYPKQYEEDLQALKRMETIRAKGKVYPTLEERAELERELNVDDFTDAISIHMLSNIGKYPISEIVDSLDVFQLKTGEVIVEDEGVVCRYSPILDRFHRLVDLRKTFYISASGLDIVQSILESDDEYALTGKR